MTSRRALVTGLALGNLVVLAGLGTTTWDLLATRQVVAEDTLEACLGATGLDPSDVVVTEVRMSEADAVTARWRVRSSGQELREPGSPRSGGVRCELVTPVAPLGTPVVEHAARLP